MKKENFRNKQFISFKQFPLPSSVMQAQAILPHPPVTGCEWLFCSVDAPDCQSLRSFPGHHQIDCCGTAVLVCQLFLS